MPGESGFGQSEEVGGGETKTKPGYLNALRKQRWIWGKLSQTSRGKYQEEGSCTERALRKSADESFKSLTQSGHAHVIGRN